VFLPVLIQIALAVTLGGIAAPLLILALTRR
jgi:hypothetical protein